MSGSGGENLTHRSKACCNRAQHLAKQLYHNYVGPEHLFVALCELEHGIVRNVLKLFKVDGPSALTELEKSIGRGSATGEPVLTSAMKKVLDYAYEEAQNFGHPYVGTEHLLLGILRQEDDVVMKLLDAFDIQSSAVRRAIEDELRNAPYSSPTIPPPFASPPPTTPSSSFSTRSSMDSSRSKTPVLQAYGLDLTEMARKGELDPVVGRDMEIEWVTIILCRRRKNNPVLVGEAGVGKTAVVEGLALMIARNQVPEILRNKRIISLDLSSMVAGTKYRGQFEERIKSMMEELKKNNDIILFIDELHTLVGAGAAEGAIDAANILKPALARGDIQCIGATTHSEYRKNIETDSALERRFQKLIVNPPTVEQTLEILIGLVPKYEVHHKVHYTLAALTAATRLSERYITHRFLPDKAIDLIDEAGAKVRIESRKRPREALAIEEEIAKRKKEKEKAISKQEYELAAEIRDEEKKLIEDLKRLLEEQRSKEEQTLTVDEEDILLILSNTTGIPLKKLSESEQQKVLLMASTLKERVVGQEVAIDRVTKALMRSKADVKDEKRPNGSFLFLGPTGVGKTHLAKSLATHIFGTSDALIHVDMSEYMEKHSIARLVGAPPGYVGHEEGGQLTEKVRLRPYSVLLFDEIEKAHQDVSNLLLQILEEGHLTDSLGRKVDFKNCIIILTSNLGSEQFESKTSLGFRSADLAPSEQSIREQVLKAARNFFKPELLNRLDDLIIFFPFKPEHLDQILQLELDKLFKRALRQEIHLEIPQDVRSFLVQKGLSPKYGARPLRRALERYLEEPLAEIILSSPHKGPKRYQARLQGEEISLVEQTNDQEICEENKEEINR